MSRDKKPAASRAASVESKTMQPNSSLTSALTSWGRANKNSADTIRAAGATAESSTSRIGPGLRVKGEVSGNEDLLIDCLVEGSVQLDERKLTIGTTARLLKVPRQRVYSKLLHAVVRRDGVLAVYYPLALQRRCVLVLPLTATKALSGGIAGMETSGSASCA